MSSNKPVKKFILGFSLLAFLPVAPSYGSAAKSKVHSMRNVFQRLVGQLPLPNAICAQPATPIAWAAATDGSWNTPTNWNPPDVPDVPGESAFIAVAGTYNVALNLSPSIDTLDLSNPGATLTLGSNTLTVLNAPGLTIAGLVRATGGPSTIVGRIVVGPSGKLIVNQSCSLALAGPTVANDGLLLVNHLGNWDSVLRLNSDVQFSGTGAIFINGDNDSDRIDGAAGVTLTNGAGHTIHGQGAINVAVNNQGNIVADESGSYLTLQSVGKVNSGWMRGTNGGILRVVGTSVENTGGSIQADGGAVQFNGAAITGGTLLGPSIISGIGDATLSGVTLAAGAQYDVNQNTTTTLMGATFVNNGLLRINHTGGWDSILVIGESMTISGSGEIFINGDNDSDRIDGAAGVTLTNPAGHTIRGEGAINVALNNQGNVISDQAGGRLTLRSGAKTNTGTFRTANGSTLLISSTSVNNTGGSIRAGDGVVQFSGAAITGGTLVGPSVFSAISDTTLSGVTLAAGAQYDVNQSTTTTLLGSTIVNNGLLRVNHTGVYDSVLAIGESMTIAGSGEIFINGDNDSDRIDGAALTLGPGQTLRGQGAVNVSLTNNGRVCASKGGRLNLATTSKISNGLFEAAAPAVLLISQDISGAGSWRASGGMVQLASGVQVTTAGSIRVTAGGVLQMLGTGNLTTGSDLFVDGASQLSANGSLVLSGDVDFLTTSESFWTWAAGSSLTMAGSGTPGGIACNTSAWAVLEVGSTDNGTGGSGNNNFGLRQLVVADGARLTLADFRDNGNRGAGREALYAESLVVGTGAVLNLNGLKLYVAGAAITTGPSGAGQVVNTPVVKLGDLNPDSVVDGRDVQAFVVGLFNPSSYPIKYPGGNLCAGDTDFDGDLDVYDVAGFVTKLLTS